MNLSEKVDAETDRFRLNEKNPGAAKSEGREEKKPSVAEHLIRIGSRAELFQDDRREPYAAVTDEKARRILRLRGRDFRRWLSGQFYKETGKAANGESMTAALGVLEAKAIFEGEKRPLHNRLARTGDVILVDLCDESWRAVAVTPGGWQVVDRPPILFRRYSHQAVLPEPVEGGDLKEFCNYSGLLPASPVRKK